MKKAATLVAIAIPAFVLANAAMGVALEQYDPTAWVVYVVATILFEAWMIGERFIGFRWWKALLISLMANFITAFCCADLCGVGLHGSFAGSPVNPIPLLGMFIMFLGFGLVSGGVESIVWFFFGRREISDPGGAIAKRTMLIHLAGVPLAMIIMLVPPHPYPFLEGLTLATRLNDLASGYNEAHPLPPGDHVTIPTASQLIDGAGGSFWRLNESDRWTLAYCPTFGRLSIGENRSMPFEWNQAVLGHQIKLDVDNPKGFWLVRVPATSRFAPSGLVYDPYRGRILRSHDPKQLGY